MEKPPLSNKSPSLLSPSSNGLQINKPPKELNLGFTVLHSANIVGNKLECDCFFLGMFNTTITAPQEKYRRECNCKHDLAVYLQWTTRGDLQSLCLARTFVLKPRTAVACRGTPLSGHTRKWNCWTWRVSLDPLCVKIRQVFDEVPYLFC